MDNLALLKQSDVLAKTVDWMVNIDILNHYLVKKQLLSKYLIGFLSHLITIHSEISVFMLDLSGPEWTLFVCLVEIKD